MAFEFYDPRRPASDLLAEIQAVVRDTISATEEYTLREVGLEAGEVMASDDVERVVVFTAALPAVDYDDQNLGPSKRLWKGWRVFFDEALRRTQPLWAVYVTADLPPNLTELRDPEIWKRKELADIWVCPELAPAVRSLPLRYCRKEEVAGGLWLSGVEAVLRGSRAKYDDYKRDGALIREALLAATDHLLPARDPKPTRVVQPPQPRAPMPAVVQAQFWKAGVPPEQLYGDLGLALVERGAQPVEPYVWDEAMPLPDGDAVEVTFPEDMPGVVVLEGFSDVVAQEDAGADHVLEALHVWLAQLVAGSGASYAALRLDEPFPPPVVRHEQFGGQVLEGPYSFAVDRTWLTERVFRKVEKKLAGAWRRDVDHVTVWWVRPGDALGVGQFDRALAAAELIAARARR
ncbi:MAG: hypothetical protein JWN77_84 [Frankiales bacterium]|jgi:hypothetical protein|nr:hypothetical protein [Frankiales bacterium]